MMAYPIFRRVVGLVGLPAAILFTLSIFTLSIGAQGARLPQRMALGNAPRANAPAASKARVSGERAGQVVTRDGLKLMLTADTGNVQVSSDAVGAVRYQVRIEADANDPAAQGLCKEFVLTARGTPQGVTLVGQMPNSRDAERVWVTYEVHVPRRYSVEIATRAGDVTTQDIAGTATLSSGAGNIQAGRIGDVQAMKSAAMPTSTGAAEHGTFVARLQTAGGHISLGDVGGGLRAMTGGGHIDAGNIYGDAVLQSGGGNLRAGHIAGAARLITGGGNIAVERVEAGVEAESAGGRIEFGEVTGGIHAGTRGGGVRVARVSGPMQLDVRDGGIVLAGVEAPLHASSATGGITASFSQRFGGAADAGNGSELSAGRGDIVVYLPRQIGMTIDAVIEHSAGGHITADPALPVKVNYAQAVGDRALHGHYALNGGGEVLHLRTFEGNIQLHVLDEATVRALGIERGFPQREGDFAGGAARPRKDLPPLQDGSDHADNANNAVNPNNSANPVSGTGVIPAPAYNTGHAGERSGNLARIWNGGWWQDLWRGGVRVAPDEQQKRLSHAVTPVYPDVARDAGIEGDVTLRLIIGEDGAVNEIKVLSGEPVLARAATEAVAQWRYAPALLDGWQVSVVTTVTLAFRLR